MATPYWNATGANQTFTTNGNWSTGAAPVTGDNTKFDGRSNNDVDGVDNSAVDHESFQVTAGYGGTIGSSGTALTIGVNNSASSQFRFAGTGPAYITGGGTGSGGSGIITGLIDNAPGGFWAGGTWGTLVITAGRVNITSSAAITTLTVLGGIVSINASATITTLNMEGGTVNDLAGGTTLNANGGVYNQIEDAAWTTLNNRGAIHNCTAAGTVVTTYNAYSGSFNPANAKGNITVTTLNRYGGFNFIRDAAGVAVTISTENIFGAL